MKGRLAAVAFLFAWWLSPAIAQQVPGQQQVVVVGVQGSPLPNFSVAPPIAPVVSSNTLSGTLGAGQYSVRLTFIPAVGETLPSASALVTLTATGQLVVTSPTCPTGVTTYNVYIGTVVGSETKQGSAIACGTNFIQSSALAAGAALPSFVVVPLQVDPTGRLTTSAPALSATGSPATPITGSNTGAASAANVTLAAAAGKFTYITGFQITGAGATAASVITVTVTGTVTGTMNYNIVVPAGVTASITPLVVTFPVPVPSSAVNTAITVNVPSFGAGNTNSAVSAQGFQQ